MMEIIQIKEDVIQIAMELDKGMTVQACFPMEHQIAQQIVGMAK